MLNKLYEIELELPKLLMDSSNWQSLFINYEKPFVERVWMQWEEYRISLHRILPCESYEAFFHPHPWPSAMRILDGKYEMIVGYGEGLEEPPMAAKIILQGNSCYEMTNPNSWHYVRPLDGPTLTLMITGKPWSRAMPKSDRVKLTSLAEKKSEEILNFFQKRYPYDKENVR